MQAGRTLEDLRIAVIGLGYVGLPLAVAFGQRFPTLGFDVSPARVDEIRQNRDSTNELTDEELSAATHLAATTEVGDIADCNFFVVTVPTPIDISKQPDLSAVMSACRTVGSVLGRGDIAVFESTVYPGLTEDVCVPILEEVSGLQVNEDFFVGYSPERINPGDRKHRLADIVKVTAGSTEDAADFIDSVYREIIHAGTHKAESIAIAEAAKVIENTQRDLNVALMNELGIIFNRMGIDTEAVLRAAGTKWNFLPFRPGLVGGHCIGVDPYYLTHKAQMLGYHPEVILAGRRVNDQMGNYVAQQLVKAMLKQGIPVFGARVLILGLTFKENCPDVRNTRVVDVIAQLEDYGCLVDVSDPWVDASAARAEYGVTMVEEPDGAAYDAIVVAVAHDHYRDAGADELRRYGKSDHILYDLKSIFPKGDSDLRL